MSIKQLRQRLADLKSEGRSILDAAKLDGGRDLTEDEETRAAEIEATIDQVTADIEAEERRLDRERSFSLDADAIRISGSEPAADKDGNPWESFGHQLRAIVEAGSPSGRVDERLLMPDRKAAATGGGSNIGSDGGFLVRKEYSSAILRRAYENGALASRCDRMPIGDGFDGLCVPMVEESSRAAGSRWGGVRVYRRNEADTVTATRPKLTDMEIALEDLMGIAYATDRSLRDASALGAIYEQAFAEEFAFELDDEIMRGTGAGECMGLLNAPATVSVAKESGQSADTIVVDNIVKMWSRMWGRSRANAAWFINQDVEPQLFTLGVVVGTGGIPVYLPPGGLADSPYARLMGRPVIPIEQASTVGDAGDITLADMSQYQLIDKDGIDGAESMHVRFLYAERTFRWIMRVNGQPKWRTALTPANGSNTLSPFVQLAARA